MSKTTDPQLVHQFNDPLPYLSQYERTLYKKKAIVSALRNIGIGLILFVVHGVADSHRLFGEPNYVIHPTWSDPYGLLAVATVSFLAYGIFQLITIRRRTIAYAREKLIAEHPSLKTLQQATVAKQEKLRNNIYRTIIYTIIGIAGLSVIALVVYAVAFL